MHGCSTVLQACAHGSQNKSPLCTSFKFPSKRQKTLVNLFELAQSYQQGKIGGTDMTTVFAYASFGQAQV